MSAVPRRECTVSPPYGGDGIDVRTTTPVTDHADRLSVDTLATTG